MEESNLNLIVPDTSVLMADENSAEKLINGGNLVVVPLTVLVELDNLKNDSRKSLAARLAIRKIDALELSNNENLIIEKEMSFEGINLDRNVHDFQILATFNYVLKNKEKFGSYSKYKLISEDINMRMIGRSLFKHDPTVVIEPYFANAVDIKMNIDLPVFPAQKSGLSFEYSTEKFGEVLENGGVLIDLKSSNSSDKSLEKKVLTMRKGEELVILDEIEVMGLKAYHKNRVNWNQLLAFHQLLDKGIHCVFLQGKPGTGKTLLALAAALQQKQDYQELILVNPMVPLGNENKMGFLPGDVHDKVSPWMKPFIQNLRFLDKNQRKYMEVLREDKDSKPKKQKNSSKTFDANENSNFLEMYDFFTYQPLDYIRGQTIANAFIIIEEAHNLTQHEMTTIVTRVGEGTKIVFCGDLSQIDIPYLTAEKSGLTYAIKQISGTGYDNKMVAVCNLNVVVRSKLAAFASKVM